MPPLLRCFRLPKNLKSVSENLPAKQVVPPDTASPYKGITDRQAHADDEPIIP